MLVSSFNLSQSFYVLTASSLLQKAVKIRDQYFLYMDPANKYIMYCIQGVLQYLGNPVLCWCNENGKE
jgi:hypothetical protein